MIAVLAYFGVLHKTDTWTERNVSIPDGCKVHDNELTHRAQVTTGLQDFIICIEMFLVSIAHGFAFGYNTYRNPNKVGFVRGILKANVRETVQPILKNLSHVVSQKDVFDESLDVFGIDAGTRHTHIGHAQRADMQNAQPPSAERCWAERCLMRPSI